jgi:hypothetical protein
MFLVRDIMFCKPGQARPMVQKFLALDKLGRQMGFGPMRVKEFQDAMKGYHDHVAEGRREIYLIER